MSIRLWKEVRGLGPVWLIVVAVMVAAAFAGLIENDARAFAMPAFAIGAFALGALSMGHEYLNGTLAQVLAQPERRWDVLARKLGALAAMLVALAAIAGLVLWNLPPRLLMAPLDLGLGVPLLCGFFLVPCLTIVTRNAMAGIVFALGAVATIYFLSDSAATLVYGETVALTKSQTFFWLGMLLVSAAASVATVRTFLRLEAVDARGIAFHLPERLFPTAGRWSKVTERRASSPWQLLVGKELRLQQLTMIVSGLYLVAGIALVSLPESLAPAGRAQILEAFTLLHAYAIPFLAGSLASAEERQLGTLGAQVLLPIPVWRQWLIKATVVASLSLVLAVALPALVHGPAAATAVLGVPLPAPGPNLARVIVTAAAVVAAVSVLSLYVSSLSSGVLRALVATLAVASLLALLGASLEVLLPNISDYRYWRYSRPQEEIWLMSLALPILCAAAAVVLLWLGLRNHQSAERSSTLARKQLGWMGVAIASSIGVMASYQVVRSQQLEREYQSRYGRVALTVAAPDAVRSDMIVLVVFFSTERGEPQRYTYPGSILSRPFSVELPTDGRNSAIAVWREGTPAADLRRELRANADLLAEVQSVAVDLPRPSWPATGVTLEPVRLP